MASTASSDTMLHIFYVNVGSMLKYDLNATKNNVGKLQDLIARHVQIPADKQILLISGGENVCQTRKLCTYSSGSDTTPFFLYHKNSNEVFMPPLELNIPPAEKNLQNQLKECLNKTISADITALRANIVKSFYQLGKAKLETCTDLVHSQHLQHQGWAVVIANLLDVTSDYLRKAELYMENLNNFHNFHHEYHQLLNDIPQVINTLEKISLPSCLPTQSSHHSSFNLSSSTSTTSSSSQHLPLTFPCKIYTLLDWINTHDSRNSLHRLVEDGKKSLQEFNDDSRQNQLKEMEGFKELVVVDRKEMKVIRGLDDRLSGLDRLMANNKRLLKEQEDMAEVFHSVHQRMQSVHDASMLAELCSSHKEYLERVSSNHMALLENSYKCYKTKRELCENLNNRLKWVMLTEQTLWQADNRLLMRHKKLTKLRHNLHILHQIKSSTNIYIRSLAEVVRRRNYCDIFMKKASETCSFYSEVHRNELQRRKIFNDAVNIQEHFLKALFPGLKDELPPFALKCPDDFDRGLPEVSEETIQSLLTSVPELAVFLEDVDFHTTDPLLISTSESPLSIYPPPISQLQPSTSQHQTQLIHTPLLADPNASNKHTQTDNLYAARVLNDSNDKSNSSSLSKSYEFIQDKFEQAKLVQSADHKVLLTVVSTSAYTTSSTPPIQTTISSPFSIAMKAAKIELVALSSSPMSSPVSIPVNIHSSNSKSTQPSPDNSPIESFLATDYYFDESMHSSDQTDPSTSKKVVELQNMLQDRVLQVDSKEKEIKELLDRQKEDTQQMDSLVERYKKLSEFCFDGFVETKSFLSNMKSDHFNFINSIKLQLSCNKEEFEDLADGVMNLLTTKETEIVTLSKKIEDLCEEMVVKDKKALEREEGWKVTEEKLESELKRLDGMVEERGEELMCVEAKYNKVVLECELEMEGLKCELGDELKEKEKIIGILESEVEANKVELERMREDAEMHLKESNNQWQIEKKKEIDVMEESFKVRLLQKEAILRNEMEEANNVKVVVKLAVIEAEHKLKLAIVLGDLKKLKGEVMCFREDLLNNEFNDCVVSDSTEFVNADGGEEDDKDEVSIVTREVSQVFQHVRVNLISLLDQLSKLKEHLLVSEEEVGRLRTTQEIMRSASLSDDDLSKKNKEVCTKNQDSTGDEVDIIHMSTSTSDLHAVISMQRHHEMLEAMVVRKNDEKNEEIEKWKKENMRFCEDLIANMSAEHELEMADASRRLKCELEEQRQITFNRALKQALRQRDDHIALLETQLEHKKSNRQKNLFKLQPHSNDKDISQTTAPTPGTSSQLPRQQRQSNQAILTQPSPSQLIPSQPTSSSSSLSCSPSSPPQAILPSFFSSSAIPSTMIQSCPDYVEKVHRLENSLKYKEQENKELRRRLNSCSSSPSDYINIKSCSEGDIVLFTQESNTSHYVAFLPSSTYKFFLHSDSLPLFRQVFSEMPVCLMAEVTGKDLCQAKKSSNRFRLPVDCKFYRVKAKPCVIAGVGGGVNVSEET